MITLSYLKAYARRIQDAFNLSYTSALQLAANAAGFRTFEDARARCPEKESILARSKVSFTFDGDTWEVESRDYRTRLPAGATIPQLLAHGAWLLGVNPYYGPLAYLNTFPDGPTLEALGPLTAAQNGPLVLKLDTLIDISRNLIPHPISTWHQLGDRWSEVQGFAIRTAANPDRVPVQFWTRDGVRATTARLTVIGRTPAAPEQLALQALNAFVPAFHDGAAPVWYPDSFTFGSAVGEVLAEDFVRQHTDAIAGPETRTLPRETVQHYLREALVRLGRRMSPDATLIRASDDLTFALFPITEELAERAARSPKLSS